MSEGKRTGKKVVFIGCLSLVLLGGLVMVPVIILLSIAGGGAPVGCVPTGTPLSAAYNGPSVAGLSQLQMSRAAAIVGQGRQMGIPDQGIVVALATASQESHFQVYANDGQGGDLKPDQAGIAASLNMSHDAVGTDHGSLGVFQQQWPWWGTMQELMDPATSAKIFYEALLKVPNWQSLPVTVAAQDVQSSAYPSAYADDQPIAEQLLASISQSSGSTTSDAGASSGPQTSVVGVEGSAYQLNNGVYIGGTPTCATNVAAPINMNGQGSFTPSTEYSWVGPYTPQQLLARMQQIVALNGTGRNVDPFFHSEPDGSWYRDCQHFVANLDGAASSGYDSASAAWAHFVASGAAHPAGSADGMSPPPGAWLYWGDNHVTVYLGNNLTAGTDTWGEGTAKIGPVADVQDWLSSQGGYKGWVTPWGKPPTAAQRGTAAVSASTGGAGTVHIGTLNWRGASHYNKNPHPGERPYSVRVPNMVAKINASGASIVGFQEFEPPQAQAFLNATNGQWALARGRVHGRADARDAIAYQPSAWTVAETRYVSINYGGTPEQIPLVRFSSTTGQGDVWVLNTHNPANVVGGTNSMRDVAVRDEAATLKSLAVVGAPVLFTGDMNDRARFKQLFLAQAGAGWSAANPTDKQIDWIMGSPGVSFGGTVVDQSTNDNAHRYTDHPFVHTTAQLSGSASGSSIPNVGGPAVAGTQLPGGGQKGSGLILGAMPVVNAQPGGTVNGSVRMAIANLPQSRVAGRAGSIRTMASAHPDFIALNEVSSWSAQQLAAATRGYDAYKDPYTNVHHDGGANSMENAVMWDASKWSLVDGGRFQFVEHDLVVFHGKNVDWNRYATWAVLKRKSDGAQVVVVSTHMMTNPQKQRKTHGNYQWASRVAQFANGMKLFRAFVGKLSAYGPVLIGGDMNVHPNQGGWSTPDQLAQDGYQWTYDHAVIYQFYPRGTSATGTQLISVDSDHPKALLTDMNLSGYVPTAPTGDSSTGAPPGLTMLSYNIDHHGADEALAQELVNSGAQVIALQNTNAATVQWLAQRLGMQAAYAPLGTWQGKTLVDNALLSRYPMYDADNSTLPVPSGAQPRGMLHAALGISRGVFVDVYATDLGGDQTSTLAQAQRAAENVDDSNCGAVLMGDLNATPGTPPIAALTNDLVDTFADGRFGPSKTTPSKKPTQRVDYVLHDKGTKVSSAQVMPAGVSTHLGVRATFSISGDCE